MPETFIILEVETRFIYTPFRTHETWRLRRKQYKRNRKWVGRLKPPHEIYSLEPSTGSVDRVEMLRRTFHSEIVPPHCGGISIEA